MDEILKSKKRILVHLLDETRSKRQRTDILEQISELKEDYESRTDECQKNGCSNNATRTCKYCHKEFCSAHIRANKPSVPFSDSRRFNPPPKAGHPCMGYDESINPGRIFSYHVKNLIHLHTWPKVDKALPMKAVVIALAIMFLLLPSVGFLHAEGLAFYFSAFSSTGFLNSVVIVFSVILIYDYITARRKFLTQEVYGAIVASTVLMATRLVTVGYSLVFIAKDMLVLSVALYASFWVCNRRKFRPALQFLAVLILVVLAVKYFGGAEGIIGLTGNIANGISQNMNEYLSSYQINATWVHEFMSNVSANRIYPLHESSYLDSIAKQRFTEMTSDGHYQITHYGAGAYDVGEVVFYPYGNTPNAYARDINTTAPLHWQLLISPQFSIYGYYVGNGPDVEAESPCAAPSELPGPNINVTQWFKSYGCTPVVVNTTWLVIDLS